MPTSRSGFGPDRHDLELYDSKEHADPEHGLDEEEQPDITLRIHRKAAGVERADLVGACVHAIARNVILDRYRSARIQLEEPYRLASRLPVVSHGINMI